MEDQVETQVQADEPLQIKAVPRSGFIQSDHEGLHTFLTFLAIFGVLGAQILLVYWKKNHYSNFQQISLIGLWLYPFVMSFLSSFFRFISLWFIYSAFSAYIIYLAYQKPMKKTTPRNVYIWFTLAYRLSYNLAVLGYGLILFELFGVNRFVRNSLGLSSVSWLASDSLISASTLMIFYGLYFGVLSRDCAEVCTDKIASVMGLKSEEGLPNKIPLRDICGICNLSIDSNVEETFELPCQHLFHEFCIAGWRIIGKKNTCPYCSEKVEIQTLTAPVWSSRSFVWYHLLDALRYLIVWNPIIIFVLTTTIHLMDSEHH